ncbi:MAG: C2H2-type zinc finger protein [Candidatus Sifarchaeia archaeon]|jgi:hypothetical protein
MAKEDDKFQGVVNEIGLERDEDKFANFNLKLGIVIKSNKKFTYNEGERIIKQLRKDLLGKNIELEAIAIPCPMCQKIFNTEAGLKQHIRRMHDGKTEPKTPKKKTRKKAKKKKVKPLKKTKRRPKKTK